MIKFTTHTVTSESSVLFDAYILNLLTIYQFDPAYITSLSLHFCLEFVGAKPMRVHTNADFP